MFPPPRPERSRKAPFVAAFAGFLAFLYYFDWRILDPRRIDWVSTNDVATNFLGFHFFRHEAWTWPPGLLVNYANGTQASVGLTDSVALLAFLLKPFNALLPPAINYLGLWIAACFVLQGWFAYRLLEAMRLPRGRAVLGAALLCLMPFMAARATLHIPLASHFLLLAALYVYIVAVREPERFRGWCVLLPLAVLIQPYLFTTISPVFGASILVLLWKGDRYVRRRTVTLSIAAVALSSIALYLVGFFTVSVENTWGTYGQLPMNLLAWFNSQGVGTFLPPLPVAEIGQTDAYMYLGVGGILVLFAGLAYLAITRPRLDVRYIPLVLAVLAVMALAVSHRVALGGTFLVELPVPHFILERLHPFRSSGRMGWLPTYLMLATAIALLARMPARGFIVLLVAAVGLNLADTRKIRETGTTVVDRAVHKGHPDCSPLPREVERVVFVPRVALEDNSIHDAWPIAICAAEQDQPINVGYLARMDLRRVDAAQREAAQWLTRPPAPRTAYAFRNPAVATALGAPPTTPAMGSFRVYVPGAAANAPAAPPLEWPWPLAIDMGWAGHGRDVELTGWAPPVQGWVWSYARDLSIVLPVPQGLSEDARLTLYARPMADMKIALKANGTPLPALDVSAARGLAWYSLTIPRDVIANARGVLRLELTLPDLPPFVPKRFYPEDKPRLWLARLGLAAIDPNVTRARLAADAPGRSLLREGWSGPEGWGTWSQGPVAKIDVPLPANRGSALRLRLLGHGFSADGPQQVTVSVKGQRLAQWDFKSLAADEWREATIPAELVDPAASEVQVVFQIARPAAPGGGDPRPLGLAIVEIELAAQ